MIENGSRFGRLTVVGSEIRAHENGSKRRFYVCRCECGGSAFAAASSLRTGNTTTCGCLQKEKAAARLLRHGESGAAGKRTAEYAIWAGMLSRCRNPQGKQFADYGGRGITVCERWSDFSNFLADMGRRPSQNHTIERQNNDKGYEPDNCAWVTKAAQARNKRSNVIVEYRGETMALAAAAEQAGIKANTVTVRLRRGWTLERALTP
ncbi:hypothetical protein FF100_04885 [Methylobacterium terricola]|uniref:HNH endonuclease n=1 Tax=Methylobacterium terricola TaxID=2583531 RepID=A0A5C4LKG5_9HYPH|nr:hypothetical protein [Methylobacterium terricola]TNC14914.1 hypothetical protein FF100_04885 [Methylobacterium terricola]